MEFVIGRRIDRSLDSVELDLLLRVFAVGAGYVNENDPVAGHREWQRAAILARRDFARHTDDRTHARVRHVTFRFDVRTTHELSAWVAQFDLESRGAHAHGLRSDFVLKRETGVLGGAVTSGNKRNEQ